MIGVWAIDNLASTQLVRETLRHHVLSIPPQFGISSSYYPSLSCQTANFLAEERRELSIFPPRQYEAELSAIVRKYAPDTYSISQVTIRTKVSPVKIRIPNALVYNNLRLKPNVQHAYDALITIITPSKFYYIIPTGTALHRDGHVYESLVYCSPHGVQETCY